MTKRRTHYVPDVDPETLEWWSLTPSQRFDETEKLWEVYLAMGGSLEPEPDSQSPFYDPDAPCPRPIDMEVVKARAWGSRRQTKARRQSRKKRRG